MDFDTFWRSVRRSRSTPDRGLVVLRHTPSSHELARRAAGEYQAEGAEVPSSDFVAWEQSRGRGRRGRPWVSPPGAGVYVSMVRCLDAERIRALPLTVPAALAGALRDVAGIDCGVKWPNDLVVGGKKIGGILIDVVTSGSGDPIAVVSFGINHGDPALFAPEQATSTRGEGSPLGLDRLATLLAEGLDEELERVERTSQILPTYRDLVVHRPGDEMEVSADDGSEKRIRGSFLGIDEQGLLRLETVDGELKLSTGRPVSP